MLGLLNPFSWIRRAISLILLIIILIPAYVALQVYNTGHNATPTKSDSIVIMGAAQNNGNQLRFCRHVSMKQNAYTKKVMRQEF